MKSKGDIKRNRENSTRQYSKPQIFDRLYQEQPPVAAREPVDFQAVSTVKADLPSEAIDSSVRLARRQSAQQPLTFFP